jgi:hypothetical protein
MSLVYIIRYDVPNLKQVFPQWKVINSLLDQIDRELINVLSSLFPAISPPPSPTYTTICKAN